MRATLTYSEAFICRVDPNSAVCGGVSGWERSFAGRGTLRGSTVPVPEPVGAAWMAVLGATVAALARVRRR